MLDYRGKTVIIDNRWIKTCIAQDFILGKVYFELEPQYANRDNDNYCKVPSLGIETSRVKLISSEYYDDLGVILK